MENLIRMTIFAQVVDAKSFSTAAVRLGLSTSAVSKQVSRLEDHFGTRLLNRTTRRFSLTEAGATLYERCARILTEIQEAERELTGMAATPRGTLKVNVPVTFGQLHIAPAMAEFLTRYPEIRIDMLMNDRVVDLIEEGFDVAIRIARLPDSSLIARRLAPNHLVVCATPAYLTQHGVPKTPEELQQHNCLTYTYFPSHNVWRFQREQEEHRVSVTGNFQANNGEALRAAVLDGVGIALLPTFIVGRDLQTGVLQPVLSAFSLSETAVYAVYPHNRHLLPKVQAFVEFFAKRFRPTPYWEVATRNRNSVRS
jgi:DNA-binding transcriptional LysR family regulator